MRSLLLLCVVTGVQAFAQTVYSWEDAEGVHYTDDPSAVPLKARKVGKQKYDEAPALVKVPGLLAKSDEAQRAVASTTPEPDEALWRSKFIEVHRRIALLRDTITALAGAVPEPTLCTNVGLSRRGACVPNPEHGRVRAKIAENSAQLQDAQRELEQLDRDASYQGIPREWRRGF